MNLLSRLPFIYDVATSDKNWTNALDQFCGDSGVRGVSLFSSDNTKYAHSAQAMNSYYAERQELAAEYFANFEDVDKNAVDFVFRQKPFKRIDDIEIWPGFLNLRQRPDLEFLARNLGVFRRAAYNISGSKGWDAIVSLNYGIEVKKYSPQQVQDADFLALHLGKALEINRFYSKLRQKYNAVLTALDNIEVGVCVALPDGEVIVKNHYAQVLFDTNDGLAFNSYNRIKLLETDMDSALDAHIRECAGTAQGKQNASEKVLLSNRKSGNAPYLIEITPLRDGDDELNDNISGALILIIDPTLPLSIKLEPIRKLFNLTKAEIEIVDFLFQGRSEDEIADIRNVTLNTIKNQRKAIYSKMEINSRAHLIRKAVSISPPII
jgi:DNA-binding CsgD family transcriptional regulator